MDEINEELLKVQKEWKEECYTPLKTEYEKDASKGKLSCAFSFGLSDSYINSININSSKRIMVVGQEANGHTFDYDTWCLEKWQKWAIDYLNYQINMNDEERKTMNFTKNNSPFWKFMRELKKEGGYDLCWNNLDKVRRYIRLDGPEWTEDYLSYDKKKKDNCERSILNKKMSDGKSLLQKEIEIAEPNFVIFAVGPKNPYYHTLCDAFFDGEDAYEKLIDSYPNYTKNAGIVEISEKLGLTMPAYYIYHPNFFQMKGVLTATIDKLIKRMETNK